MKRVFAPVLAAALLGAACSTLQISTDYDKNVDFTQFKTFSYHDTGEARNDIVASRIENVLSDALTAKGLKRVPDGGDLWLVPHPRLSKQTQINSYNSGWGYGYGYRGGYGGMGTTTTTVSEIPVGTLVVDLVDGKKKDLVWRGIASDSLKTDASPEEREQNLRNATAELFANFPPAKK